MEVLIVIVVIIVIVVLIRFFVALNRQNQKVAREGGMTIKYETLISYMMSGDQRTKVYQVTQNSVTLGLSNIGGTTIFILTQTFGRITIRWKLDSPFYGKHNLEWEFDESSDQEKIAIKINKDVGRYCSQHLPPLH